MGWPYNEPTDQNLGGQNLYGASYNATPNSKVLAARRTDHGSYANRTYMGAGGNVSSRPSGQNANMPKTGMGRNIQRARRKK